MKKLLLFSFIFIIASLSVFAYETVIIKYPPDEMWVKAYYKKVGNEALLQYVPLGQNKSSWTRAIFVHSYEESPYAARDFMINNTNMMIKTNPTGKYKYLIFTDNDFMVQRCTNSYKNVAAQCEFYRVTRAHGGLISLHYINKNKDDFKANYNLWYNIIRKAKYYNTYYRDDRVLDKAEYFEL